MSIFCLLNLVQLQLIPASVGFFFLNPAAEIMLNMLVNTLLKMTTVRVKSILLAGMELERHRNVHKVSLNLPINMEAPAVTENRRDYNVGKLLKCPTRTHAENAICTIFHTRLK